MARADGQRGGRRLIARRWSRAIVIVAACGVGVPCIAGIAGAEGVSSDDVDHGAAVAANSREVWVPPVGAVLGDAKPEPLGEVAALQPAEEERADRARKTEAAQSEVEPVDATVNERVAATPSATARPLGPARGRGGASNAAAGGAKGVDGAGGGGLGVRGEIPRTAIALGGVLTLILVFAAAVKKFGRSVGGRGWSIAAMLGPAGRAPSGVMRVLARYPVVRGQTLVLLQVDRRVLLLSHTHSSVRFRGGQSGFTTLAEFNDPEEVASLVLKSGAAGESTGDSGFASAMMTQDAGYRTVGRVEPACTPGADRQGAEPNRLVRRSADGDRAELWDDRAVLRASRDGREWVSADAPGTVSRAEPIDAGGPAVSVDAMDSIRHRLAGLRGRGVLG